MIEPVTETADAVDLRLDDGHVAFLDLHEALEETAYLLRSPKNARRLLESIVQLEESGGSARSLAE